ncbi:YgiW/YdeI family stress tolerance OB fold protein [Comamonas endophytica]|uniref:NirD/YgiW/YdeI family stress tolerance protein n=1 Tax=Comamonas endophytica TaxID=2949090 RepID=A0ABY6G8T2_9BURK|nr:MULTISPECIES: NirD/YgiW/YdeI family stress tolerance protein [unclassified Acidovorax]MCD2511711.1 NirD/YgiW/YdeI family stress tolerance protein [Acidovorax sp. D4N7]UYG51440.1 NirD/YgiW/YdeI family stress tolerance protein [Acidovorax sp. 5MLIR]
MRTIASTLTLSALLALGTAAATAQPAGYTGPSNAAKPAAQGSYSGPSNVPLLTVKQLLDTGKDDQHARLQGRIVSHDGGDRYTFEDASGRISIEIDDEDFPAGQTIGADQRVELLGEFDKGLRKTEFEVDRITVLR